MGHFFVLMLLDTSLGAVGGIVAALLMVTYTYFWEFSAEQISVLMAGPIILAVIIAQGGSAFFNRVLEKQQLLSLRRILLPLPTL